MTPQTPTYLAGHTGMVGSAILRALEQRGYENVLTRSHSDLDLTVQAQVEAFFDAQKPEVVILAAAKVGGILANDTYGADFIRENLLIQDHVIDAAHRHGVQRLLFLGSSCVYPRDAESPISEDALLTGPLEPTNRPYAAAKIAGIEMCRAYNRQHDTRYLPVMPCNLYGPHDNFDPDEGHVLAALLHKFHRAKVAGDDEVTVWGSGTPRREFMHVDDLADACVWLLEETDRREMINIGTGSDITIRELADTIRDVVGFDGDIVWDRDKPDGVARKLLDTSQLTDLGWTPSTDLRDGIEETYAWYSKNVA